jgi:hypothetical protein
MNFVDKLDGFDKNGSTMCKEEGQNFFIFLALQVFFDYLAFENRGGRQSYCAANFSFAQLA